MKLKYLKNVIWGIFLPLVTLSFIVDASSEADGEEYCDTKQCVKQFKQVRKLAKNGSPDAQGILAGMYMEGYGTQIDNKKAMRWLKKAAKYGGYYRNKLAMVYMEGTLTEKDTKRAVELLTVSQENGDIQAAYLLGTMYAIGKYVEKDINKAKELLMSSAMAGDAEAQFSIGRLYENGELGEGMVQQAIEFYKVAMSQNHSGARARLLELAPQHVSKDEQGKMELVEVVAPPLGDLITASLDEIKDNGLFSGSGTTGSRISGHSCIASGECKFMLGGAVGRSVYYSDINATFARIAPPVG